MGYTPVKRVAKIRFFSKLLSFFDIFLSQQMAVVLNNAK